MHAIQGNLTVECYSVVVVTSRSSTFIQLTHFQVIVSLSSKTRVQYLALRLLNPGLPLGLEAPIMTPNGVIFLFFSCGGHLLMVDCWICLLAVVVALLLSYCQNYSCCTLPRCHEQLFATAKAASCPIPCCAAYASQCACL